MMSFNTLLTNASHCKSSWNYICETNITLCRRISTVWLHTFGPCSHMFPFVRHNYFLGNDARPIWVNKCDISLGRPKGTATGKSKLAIFAIWPIWASLQLFSGAKLKTLRGERNLKEMICGVSRLWICNGASWAALFRGLWNSLFLSLWALWAAKFGNSWHLLHCHGMLRSYLRVLGNENASNDSPSISWVSCQNFQMPGRAVNPSVRLYQERMWLFKFLRQNQLHKVPRNSLPPGQTISTHKALGVNTTMWSSS